MAVVRKRLVQKDAEEVAKKALSKGNITSLRPNIIPTNIVLLEGKNTTPPSIQVPSTNVNLSTKASSFTSSSTSLFTSSSNTTKTLPSIPTKP